jgi:hypothetical protein
MLRGWGLLSAYETYYVMLTAYRKYIRFKEIGCDGSEGIKK